MDKSAKYIIHATIAANGVVERSDVVGAIFGQTEGLLGNELDLRDLQDASKVGRIDVEIESENGQSFGDVLVASSLDRVETAILGASLETISRVGPCRATIEIDRIEDIRAAKRRQIVDRARELLADSFEESVLTSDEIRQAVAESNAADVTNYSDLPAGPRVKDSDAVIVVEGRADVAQLLQHGIKNAIAVEGTDVPDAVARLTQERTVTAFLDGDRGGELILQELSQIGDIDYVAFAPTGESVENLDRDSLLDALRAKISIGSIADVTDARTVVADERDKIATTTEGETDSSSNPTPDSDTFDRALEQAFDETTENATNGSQEDPTNSETTETDSSQEVTNHSETNRDDESPTVSGSLESDGAESASAVSHSEDPDTNSDTDENNQEQKSTEDTTADTDTPSTTTEVTDPDESTGKHDESADKKEGDSADPSSRNSDSEDISTSRSLMSHVAEVIDGNHQTDRARLLDDDGALVSEVDTDDLFETIRNGDFVPSIVIVDGVVEQRLLDVAAQRGVSELIGQDEGDFVKQPLGTRVRTVEDLRAEA